MAATINRKRWDNKSRRLRKKLNVGEFAMHGTGFGYVYGIPMSQKEIDEFVDVLVEIAAANHRALFSVVTSDSIVGHYIADGSGRNEFGDADIHFLNQFFAKHKCARSDVNGHFQVGPDIWDMRYESPPPTDPFTAEDSVYALNKAPTIERLEP